MFNEPAGGGQYSNDKDWMYRNLASSAEASQVYQPVISPSPLRAQLLTSLLLGPRRHSPLGSQQAGFAPKMAGLTVAQMSFGLHLLEQRRSGGMSTEYIQFTLMSPTVTLIAPGVQRAVLPMPLGVHQGLVKAKKREK